MTTRPRHRLLQLLFALAATAAFAAAQATTAARDPQALALAAQGLAAMHAQSLQSLVLTGSVQRWAGGEQSGSFTLEATALGQSKVELDLDGGTVTEVRDSSPAHPKGQWSGPDGAVHTLGFHNLWAAPVWFLPDLGMLRELASRPELGLRYEGKGTREGVAVQHVSLAVDGSPDTLAAGLSRVDLYLDATTLLPRFLDFTSHPDNDLGTDLPIEVVFSDYQPVQGVNIPFHIQRYLRQTLVLDLKVAAATVNPALPAGDFSLR